MEIKLERKYYKTQYTIGNLYINNKFVICLLCVIYISQSSGLYGIPISSQYSLYVLYTPSSQNHSSSHKSSSLA